MSKPSSAAASAGKKNAPANPSSSHSAKKSGRPSSTALIGGAALILTLGAGFLAGRLTRSGGNESESASDRVQLRAGAWGDLEYVPITIAAPTEMLKVRGVEDAKVQWFFTGTTRIELDRLLEQAGTSASVRGALLSPAAVIQYADGLLLNPACASIRDVPEEGKAAVFGKLAGSTQNSGTRWEFQARFLESFSEYGVSGKSRKVVEAYSVRNGKSLLTYAMPCVLRDVAEQPEKEGILKALTQQQSMLLRLKVGPKSDLDALVRYWGKGMWATNVRAILESIQKRPGGGSVDLAQLFPPLPTSLFHTYPVPHNVMSGPEVLKNCSWTAFNFFSETPDPGFSDARYVIGKLETDYYPIQSDPRFGDVAIFLTPEKLMIHVATFVADDVFFTKNGDNPWHPWVYSTSSDLMEEFGFGLPEGQKLTIEYYRNKYY
jgi:hypothetical protein